MKRGWKEESLKKKGKDREELPSAIIHVENSNIGEIKKRESPSSEARQSDEKTKENPWAYPTGRGIKDEENERRASRCKEITPKSSVE